MKQHLAAGLVLLAGALAAGCETTAPWSEQDWAGITTIEVEGNGLVPQTFYKSGKEAAGIKLAFHSDGAGAIDVELEASDVKAFDGIALRAEVSKALAAAQVEIAPGLLDAIVDAVKLFMGVP